MHTEDKVTGPTDKSRGDNLGCDVRFARECGEAMHGRREFDPVMADSCGGAMSV